MSEVIDDGAATQSERDLLDRLGRLAVEFREADEEWRESKERTSELKKKRDALDKQIIQLAGVANDEDSPLVDLADPEGWRKAKLEELLEPSTWKKLKKSGMKWERLGAMIDYCVESRLTMLPTIGTGTENLILEEVQTFINANDAWREDYAEIELAD